MSLPAFRPAHYADLHLLGVLAQTQSYTQAAARLGLSKASVSQRIADLERSAGVPLVRRSTRSVALTEAGAQLVADTQAAFAQIEQGFGAVRDLAAAPRGLVRVSCPVALGRQHIAPLLPAFHTLYPEIRIELDLGDRLVNLAREGWDLAIRHTASPPENLVAIALCSTRAQLVASAGYLARHPVPTRPEALAEHACLLYLREPGGQSWSFVRGSGRRQQHVQVRVRGPLRANNSEVLRDAALGGMGIALLPDFTAAAGVAAGALVPVLPQWRPVGFFGDRIYALRPPAARVPRAVQSLVEFLKESLQGAAFAAPG